MSPWRRIAQTVAAAVASTSTACTAQASMGGDRSTRRQPHAASHSLPRRGPAGRGPSPAPMRRPRGPRCLAVSRALPMEHLRIAAPAAPPFRTAHGSLPGWTGGPCAGSAPKRATSAAPNVIPTGLPPTGTPPVATEHQTSDDPNSRRLAQPNAAKTRQPVEKLPGQPFMGPFESPSGSPWTAKTVQTCAATGTAEDSIAARSAFFNRLHRL